jgi:hypothetical protein
MPFVQFRVHPSVGCARMGNSENAYYLASEFPQFMQEEFPNLRFKPKPRRHPKEFFGANETALNAAGDLAVFNIYRSPAFQAKFTNKFKEDVGLIFPQAARFRVFAYVYFDEDSRHPDNVFEVTTDIAEIVWKVNIANKKSKKTTAPAADPHPNLTTAPAEIDTTSAQLRCDRIRPIASLPTLAYLFLERDDGDKTKVTGRLHVIGNEGDTVGTTEPSGLWSDDWYDSAGDGSVEAIIKPKGGGAALRTKAGAVALDDFKYLAYGEPQPQDGLLPEIRAVPGWVVVGCPDYSPDTGHFVSIWDIALSRGLFNIDTRRVFAQRGKHKIVVFKSELEKYMWADYFVHIHPQLCLFEDVRFLSGQAFGLGPSAEGRGHNKHPGTPPPVTATDLNKKVGHGGVAIAARTKKADYANPLLLKTYDATKPINDWLKIAVFKRLRKPGTLYDKTRKAFIRKPGATTEDDLGNTREEGVWPRKLGRRMDYDKQVGPDSDKNLFYEIMSYKSPPGNLRKFHGLKDKGELCGHKKSPPTDSPPGTTLSADDKKLLDWLDDMFWPASFSDMPMLRELAYTYLQYAHFEVWQAADSQAGFGDPRDIDKRIHHDVRLDNIFDRIVSSGLKRSFAGAGEADKHFADFLAARPKYVPAMIDMAHMGAMLGGSFIPGIEVGREAGIAPNWCLFHGGTEYFPDIRFKPSFDEAEHTLGTLTKDLAVPWAQDYEYCDEVFWPTARPGMVTKDGTTRTGWMIHRKKVSNDPDEAYAGDEIPHLGGVAATEREHVEEYWKSLGFIRRTADDKFLVAE